MKLRLPYTRQIGGRLGWSFAVVIVLMILGWSVSSSALRAVDTSFTELITRADELAGATFAMTKAMLDQETSARKRSGPSASRAWMAARLRDVQSGRRAAVMAEATEAGKRRFDAVRAAAHALLAHLQEESRQALACSRDTVTRARGLGMLVFFGTVALVVLLAWRLTRSIPHGAPALCLIRAAQGSVPMPTLTRHDSL